MSNGTRTRDHLDHNQELYQLSHTHQDFLQVSLREQVNILAKHRNYRKSQ